MSPTFAVDSRGVRPRRLVVIFHGLQGADGKMADVERLARDVFPDAIFHMPRLPHARASARVRAAATVRDQIDRIGKLCAENDVGEIVLVGHSMGAVMARRLVVEATGLAPSFRVGRELEDAGPAEGEPATGLEEELRGIEPQEWASKVTRLVTIAGMGRGWSLDNAKSGFQKLFWRVLAGLGHLWPGAKPTVFDVRRGSPFIVQTRLRWMDYRRTHRRVQLIQILGTVDPLVAPNDTVDYAEDPEEGNLPLVEVPASDHSGVLRLTPPPGHESTPVTSIDGSVTEDLYATRKRILRAALVGDLAELSKYAVRRDYLGDELPPPPNPDVTDLVFVIHGIRDLAHWTKRIAARIKALAKKRGLTFVSRTPAYGYFPILPFLLPWYRRHKVEWLMDHYVEARAAYPCARFHYVGHSNGTYLCAKALEEYPAAAFQRIMFAGSVVRPNYDWLAFIRQGRVGKVYNAIATSDLVVALFPNGLRWLRRFFDLGGAGHRGFDASSSLVFQLDYPSPGGSRRRFVRGGHSAGRQESQWDEIAEFIVDGKYPGPANRDFASRQPAWSRVVGLVSPGVVLLIAAVLLAALAAVGIPIVSELFSLPLEGGVEDLLPANGLARAWKSWTQQGLPLHLAALLGYFWFLRFMFLRF